MRTKDTTRGSHPILDSSNSFNRAWLLDETDTVTAKDVYENGNARTMTPFPPTLPSGVSAGLIGQMRTFAAIPSTGAPNGLACLIEPLDLTHLNTLMTGPWTYSVWFRWRMQSNATASTIPANLIVPINAEGTPGNAANAAPTSVPTLLRNTDFAGFQIQTIFSIDANIGAVSNRIFSLQIVNNSPLTGQIPGELYGAYTGTAGTVFMGNGSNNGTEWRVPLFDWNHVAIQRTGPSTAPVFQFWINGFPLAITTGLAGYGTTATTQRLVVGGSYGAAAAPLEVFDGDIGGLYFWNRILTETEIVDQVRRGHQFSFHTAVNSRAEITRLNFSGSVVDTIDPGNFLGQDFIRSMTINRSAEDPVSTANIELDREIDAIRLAPLVTDSIANQSLVPIASLLSPMEIFTARVPFGINPRGSDWMSIFKGEVTDRKFGGNKLLLECVDEVGILARSHIETENINHPINLAALGLSVRPASSSNPFPRFWDGATNKNASLESVMQSIRDAYDVSVGAPVLTSTFPVFGNMRSGNLSENSNAYPQKNIYFPFGSGASFPFYYMPRIQPVLRELEDLAAMIGAKYRLKYIDDPGNIAHGNQDGWRETMIVPQLEDPAVACVLDLSFDVSEVSSADESVDDVRTVVRYTYNSSEAPRGFGAAACTALGQLWNANVKGSTATYTGQASPEWDIHLDVDHGVDGFNNPGRNCVEIRHRLSDARYKRNIMIVGDSSTGAISKYGDAIAFAMRLLKAVNEPYLYGSFSMSAFPELDIDTYCKVLSDRYLWTASQRLAIKSLTLNLGNNPSMTISVGGKPTLGSRAVLAKEARPGQGRPPPRNNIVGLGDAKTSELTPIITGVLQRSDYGVGGKFLQIKNSGFENFTSGVGNPPDGWSVINGITPSHMINSLGVTVVAPVGKFPVPSYYFDSSSDKERFPDTAGQPANGGIGSGSISFVQSGLIDGNFVRNMSGNKSLTFFSCLQPPAAGVTSGLRAQLVSDFFPVNFGGTNNDALINSWTVQTDFDQPLGYEMTYTRSGNALASNSDPVMKMTMEWYDENKILLAVTPFQAPFVSVGANNPNRYETVRFVATSVTLSGTVLTTWVANAMSPTGHVPPSAKWAKLYLKKNELLSDGTVRAVTVDSVAVYKAARTVFAKKITALEVTTAATSSVKHTRLLVRAPWTQAGEQLAKTIDSGNQWFDMATLPVVGNFGSYFRVKESGLYEVNVNLTIQGYTSNLATTIVNTSQATIHITQNGVYDANANRTAGVSLYSKLFSYASIAQVVISFSVKLEFQYGDRITIDFQFNTVSASFASSGIVNGSNSNISIKQIIND